MTARKRLERVTFCAALTLSLVMSASAEPPWPMWRGPAGNNHAPADATAPLSLEDATVAWKTPVPGRGHGSPIVVGDLIVLPTADTTTGEQRVLGFDRADGSVRFNTLVNRGGLATENHPKNTEASSTCASDGTMIFCTFYHHDAIHLTALSTTGEKQWEENLGSYTLAVYKYGYAASPTLYKDLVLVVADHDGDAFLCAREQGTGRERWRTPRHGRLTFSSPIVATTSGRDQIVISGGGNVVSYDPETGKPLWTSSALPLATCGTMVWDDKRVYGSGGYPESRTSAIASDGSGRIVWSNNVKCYEQSLLLVGDYLYAVADSGVAYCWRASDGKEMWKSRLGGSYSSSPVLVGDTIHVFNEAGTWFAFKADPSRLVPVAKSQLGDEAFATPAVVGDTMFMRYAESAGGRRQEYLTALKAK